MKQKILASMLFVSALAAAEGDAVFKARCTACHGSDGKGKSAIGTPDFTSAKTQSGISDADIIDTITNGRKGTIMPAWKGKLSDEEIAAVAAYLRSLGRK
ncbi:MAG TPA: c-type cytochrome [Candidatus Solibacter sp.]|nr:c-type cytochrome [Candidatus Solibacter sp.]